MGNATRKRQLETACGDVFGATFFFSTGAERILCYSDAFYFQEGTLLEVQYVSKRVFSGGCPDKRERT